MRPAPLAPLLPLTLLAQLSCDPVKVAGEGEGEGEGEVLPPEWGYDSRPSNTTCKAPNRPVSSASVKMERVYPGVSISQLVGLFQAPGDDSRWWALSKKGTVYTFPAAPPDEDDGVAATVVLDLSDDVVVSSEAGLLGLAFHPDFAANGTVYLSTTRRGGRGEFRSVLSGFHSDDGGLTLDPDSEVELFEVDQPYSNHNGGHIAFGPDGYLYMALGDGGSGGDPLGNAQNTDEPLGSLLRLDVDGGDPYGIPDDNPFADGGGAPEIFAWGLRNTWRFSFDRETGALWAGDVGQNEWEEVDLIELGGNYGWNTMEGFECYRSGSCDDTGLISPIYAYSHDGGDASVTGGYIYRGSKIPALIGTYIFTDYYPRPLWALTYDAVTGEPGVTELLASTGTAISAFAEDKHGELYLLDYSGGGVYALLPADDSSGEDETEFPPLLSETGCVNVADPSTPPDGVFPYGVNAPLWSDGADKARAFAVPDGATITVDEDGDWELPVGSVTIKTFFDGDAPMETRLLVHHEDGWAGYTYQWNSSGTDATLLPSSARATFGDTDWTYPSRNQCLECHTALKGRTLGLETAQLNGDFVYPNGAEDNQIALLDRLGLFASSPGDPATLPALPQPQDETLDSESRSRAYLHANCAMCHLPGGTGLGSMDLRYDTPFDETGLCDTPPENGDLGVDGAVLLAPGAPERSVLSLRMHALDYSRMPSLGSAVVDEQGAALIDTWIGARAACD